MKNFAPQKGAPFAGVGQFIPLNNGPDAVARVLMFLELGGTLTDVAYATLGSSEYYVAQRIDTARKGAGPRVRLDGTVREGERADPQCLREHEVITAPRPKIEKPPVRQDYILVAGPRREIAQLIARKNGMSVTQGRAVLNNRGIKQPVSGMAASLRERLGLYGVTVIIDKHQDAAQNRYKTTAKSRNAYDAIVANDWLKAGLKIHV